MSVKTATKTMISVREILRCQTDRVHERLHEHPMFVGLVNGNVTDRNYRALLAALYGFHRPLEAVLRNTPQNWWFGLDLKPRLRAHRLAEDLACLGFDWTRADLLPFARLEPFDNPGRLLGCLYVREGATLGGQVLARGLEPMLGSGDAGRRFFTGTDDNGRLWRDVCDALETAGAAGHLDDIIEGACTTFEAFENWMNRAHARLEDQTV